MCVGVELLSIDIHKQRETRQEMSNPIVGSQEMLQITNYPIANHTTSAEMALITSEVAERRLQ